VTSRRPLRAAQSAELGGPTRGATEGGTAEAAPEAAGESRESRREAAARPAHSRVRSRRLIVRRVLSALTTSRAAQPAGYNVVLIDTVTPSRLPLHLTITSRIDLLLRRYM
jgi:hypothetical protein